MMHLGILNKMTFEFDEEKALKQAFAKARAKNKMFNVNSWKIKREMERTRLLGKNLK